MNWELIDRLHKYFADNGNSASEQIIKLFEEAGEVAAAWIGWTGSNPRKGATHTTRDIVGELQDVIITACIALNYFSDQPHEDFEAAFSDRGKYNQRLVKVGR